MRFDDLAGGLKRAAPLAFLLGSMACGQSMGGGGCGPALDADKIAAEAKSGTGGAKSGANDGAKTPGTADAAIAKGAGYKPGAYADRLSGFSSEEGGGGTAGAPKSEFSRLAQSLPPTRENLKLVTDAMGPQAARSGPGGSSTDLAGNGGYVTLGKGADGQPTWQWNAYDGGHKAPAGFEKPYVPAAGADGTTLPANTNPALIPPSGFKGCWPRPPGLNKINLGLLGGNGNRRVVDSTPIVCSRDYCAVVMNDPNRGCCPLRPEGDPMRTTCEAEVMGKDPSDGRVGPRWVYKGNGRIEKHGENAYLAYSYGDGWAGACSNLSPVCNWIEVKNSKAPEAPAPAAGPARSTATIPIGPAPSTTTTPSPVASTATAPGACDIPPLHHINVGIRGGNGQRMIADATPYVCSTEKGTKHEWYCQETMGDNSRFCCPVKPEGHPDRVKCEVQLLGKDPKDGVPGPRWEYVGHAANSWLDKHYDNPFLAFAYGTGIARACSNVSSICGEAPYRVP